MTKFKKFYFFHIDKTLGSMVAPHLLDPLYNIMEENGISAIENNASHELHNFWQDFDEDTYIYSCFRDPYSRIISEYTYSSNYDINGFRKDIGNLREWQSPHVSLDGFISWYKEYDNNNYQAKVLSGGDLSSDAMRKNFNRINFKTTTDFIKGNAEYVRSKILSDLGITHKFNRYNPDHEINFYSEFNGPLIDSLNNRQDIQKMIIENNYLDKTLYDSCAFNKEL